MLPGLHGMYPVGSTLSSSQQAEATSSLLYEPSKMHCCADKEQAALVRARLQRVSSCAEPP